MFVSLKNKFEESLKMKILIKLLAVKIIAGWQNNFIKPAVSVGWQNICWLGNNDVQLEIYSWKSNHWLGNILQFSAGSVEQKKKINKKKFGFHITQHSLKHT